jgi:hypothetical protein
MNNKAIKAIKESGDETSRPTPKASLAPSSKIGVVSWPIPRRIEGSGWPRQCHRLSVSEMGELRHPKQEDGQGHTTGKYSWGGGTGVVITAGSWKKLDWLRELQTAEITTLSHDRNIHRTQEESRTHTSAARCQQREAEGGSSGQFRRQFESSSEQLLQWACVCLASSCVHVRGKGRCSG